MTWDFNLLHIYHLLLLKWKYHLITKIRYVGFVPLVGQRGSTNHPFQTGLCLNLNVPSKLILEKHDFVWCCRYGSNSSTWLDLKLINANLYKFPLKRLCRSYQRTCLMYPSFIIILALYFDVIGFKLYLPDMTLL